MRIGKPFLESEVYDILQIEVERAIMMCVGDALETDIAGGNAAGADALFGL